MFCNSAQIVENYSRFQLLLGIIGSGCFEVILTWKLIKIMYFKKKLNFLILSKKIKNSQKCFLNAETNTF
jgi:uncharacterized membrane protein YciS (DUF1049 family)